MKRPTITARELVTIERLLKMEEGYVLKFSNRAFTRFFIDFQVDIDQLEGGKACRLRTFLEAAEPGLAADVLEELLEVRRVQFPIIDVSDSPLIDHYRKTIARLRTLPRALPTISIPLDILTLEYVTELDNQTNKRLAEGEFEGAITTARTMLEAVLRELEIELTGASSDYEGNLAKQYKAVSKQLRIDDTRNDLDEHFRQVVRGLVQVVKGLAPIRNKMSDSHPRERKPAPHHARVVANSAKTVAGFLIESYLFQRERGTLPSLPSNER